MFKGLQQIRNIEKPYTRNSIFNKEIGTLEIVSAYEIIDAAGDELSSAGGPGISLIYFLGFMPTGIAGTSLVMRKRRRAA